MPPRIVRARPRCSALSCALAALALGCAKSGDRPAQTGDGASPGTGFVVNGAMLSAETVQQLQQRYPVPVPPGRYWYDAISGADGREGEPIAGRYWVMAGGAGGYEGQPAIFNLSQCPGVPRQGGGGGSSSRT